MGYRCSRDYRRKVLHFSMTVSAKASCEPAAGVVSVPISCASSAWRPVKLGGISRQRPDRRCRERARRLGLPGCQHLGRRASPRATATNSARQPGQAPRVSKQPGGVPMGCAMHASLQVTDCPQAQPAHPARARPST